MDFSTEDLRITLEKHRAWLNGERGGERASFKSANLIGMDLNGACLINADFTNANLQKVFATNADISGADFTGTDLRDSRFVACTAKGTKFEGADLTGSYFNHADLTNASFNKSTLVRANFSETNITKANFTETILTDAVFTDAILEEGCAIKRAPIQINGLGYGITIWDTHLEIGCQRYRLYDCLNLDDRTIIAMDGQAAAKFCKKWGDLILTFARANGCNFDKPISTNT